MAENQPVNPTAPTAPEPQTPAPVPATNPADNQPAPQASTTFTLSDDQKNYLKGQGLTDEDLNSPEALSKIISHAQSSQKTAAQIKAEYDKVRNLVSPTQEPMNPFAVPAQPTTPSTPAPEQTQQQPVQGIDQTTAFLVTSQLSSQYKELTDDLSTGKFYQDMASLGIPVVTAQGLNLAGIQNFAARRQRELQLEAQIEAANKPGEDSIPDANPTAPQQPADNFVMDKQKAQAIILQDKSHPRYAEAAQFLQKR